METELNVEVLLQNNSLHIRHFPAHFTSVELEIPQSHGVLFLMPETTFRGEWLILQRAKRLK